MEIIPYNPRRFESAAASYLQGRPAYPAKLFRRIVDLCGLNRSHRVMDLGCGPAQIAVALAPYVAQAVGVDPEPEMLTIAAENAAAHHQSIELIESSSYDVGPRFGRFQLVAMGRSFHWMDRVDTLQRLDALVDPHGAVALLYDEHPEVPENAWRQPFQEVVKRYSADDFAKQVRSNWRSHEAVLLASPFHVLERITIFDRRSLSVDDLIVRTRSMSSVSSSRIGARADDLAAELQRILLPFAQEGALSEVTANSALIATRASANDAF